MRWTWDPNKDRINRRKHRVGFETAQLVFDDLFAASRPDPYPDERRWQTIGMIAGVVVIAITPRPNRNRKPAKRSGASSAPERRRHGKGKPMKKGASKALTKRQKAELKALAALPDRRIDTSDIPEALDWSDAKRGLFYRPVKQQLTLRLDRDVVAWFKQRTGGGRGYQTEINRALREYVRQRRKHGADA